MNMLLLTRYDRLGASSRVRMLQYLPYLDAAGVTCRVEPLLGDDYLQALYRGERPSAGYLLSRYLRRLALLLRAGDYEVAFIEKELLPNVPAWFEPLLAAAKLPYIVDFDDAIFHNYDLSRNPFKRLLKRKIEKVMRHAATVTAGSSYLADYAQRAGAKHIALLPTVIDLNKYSVPAARPDADRLVIGWIGSPSTVQFLAPLLPVIARLAQEFPLELAVVGGRIDDAQYRFVRHVPWSEATEADEIARFDIGVMPLPDRPWERGKCSYKLIQCMACGKPVVASPVGMNVDVVQQDRNGYLPATPAEWHAALHSLLSDAELRRAFGLHGRRLVEERYCVQVTAPTLVRLVQQTASRQEASLCAE